MKKQIMRTVYVKPEDKFYWDKAKVLFPYHLGKSVSQFVSAAIKAQVEHILRLEGKK